MHVAVSGSQPGRANLCRPRIVSSLVSLLICSGNRGLETKKAEGLHVLIMSLLSGQMIPRR